ncbi:MAG: lysophospholipid acyltransferase family protein [Bacteroidales bacterium]
MHLIGFLLSYPLLWLISLLPLRILYLISDYFLFPLVYHVIRYRKKVVFENLRNAFPQKSEKERRQIARKFYHYFCDLLVETVKLLHISEKEYKRRIRFKNPEVIEELYHKGYNIIAVTGHYGNWEWLSGVSNATPYQNMSLYKPLSNKYFEKVLTRIRTRFGAHLVPINDTMRRMISYRQEGTRVLSCFISDQTPLRSHIQYWTRFLNQDTPMYLGPEKLARAFHQAVIFLKIIRTKRGYYQIEVVKLFEDVDQVHDHEITEAHVRELENLICEKPEYWLWTHRRWKHKKPAHAES